MSPRRAARLLGPPDRHRFLFGRGMVSDDTEHTCMVLQSLLASGADLAAFERDFAARLQTWLALLPAGAGLATAKSIVKLWLGCSPRTSGVHSAGNGPAMRAAILGVLLPPDSLDAVVASSTRITHTDPRANWGAIAVALAAHHAAAGVVVEPQAYEAALARQLAGEPAGEFLAVVRRAVGGIAEFPSTADFAAGQGLGRGVGGYVLHTVPVAIHAWLRHQRDYRSAVVDVIRCGGDADTTAAIVGGIVGAGVGPGGIPDEWRRSLCDWPLTECWLARLAEASAIQACGTRAAIPELSLPGRALRNLVFLAAVLAHGFRRLAPPY